MSENGHDQTDELTTEKKSKKRLYLLIGLMAILFSAMIFFIIRSNRLEAERIRQEEALTTAYIQLDSLSNELDERILTISQLGGEIDTLLAIKGQLEGEKKDLLDREKRNNRTIQDLQDKVEGYQELLLIKDEEIKQLTMINEQLLSENTDLKEEKAELNQSIRTINEEKDQLAEKVEIMSLLKIEGLQVIAVSNRGKERVAEFRNRHIEQLKIMFTVSENKVAPIEGKELLVRIVTPDGNVLFDVTRGSGTFMFEGREMFYTAKKEILYDRNNQQVMLFYEKGSEYPAGRHTVEVYTDQYLMGSGSFVVKS